ncbi:LPS assembly lipoprotein LptE [Azospirillum sp. BE72]|uniref:LPS assembly lipoprotein LptE n=1 Tax=Azospirillum sp. BE72 TaxID=2817776 RepID=UPI0028635E62|nr:LPS assembly lipoprotein LptE [Azospirillum sp. BE72]MDR6775052.1 LPS-assembly lipoprotein [Azospirillum sp. BE72]
MSSSDPSPIRQGSFRRSPIRQTAARGLFALALGLSAASLSGCGFQPLYGGKGVGAAAADRLMEVDIASIPDREGQKLRNLLIDNFYPSERPSNPRYRLDVALSASEQKLALQKDATAVRAQLLVNAPYRLTDTQTGQVVFQSSSRSMISYNTLEQHYAAIATVQSAYDRALEDISNDITTRVAMYLGRGS